MMNLHYCTTTFYFPQLLLLIIIKKIGDVANGGAGHVLSNNGNNVNLRNLSIGEVYQDIRYVVRRFISVSMPWFSYLTSSSAYVD